jgi:predicted dehydrogenase
VKPAHVNQLRPLDVALVGCGRWGKTLANAISALPEFTLKWVCDPVVRRPGTKWAPSLTDEVCRDVDAVIVATPPDQHLAPTLTAVSAGKPVLVEKPFMQSLGDVRQVKTAQGATPVMVGHLLAYHPGYLALLEWARAIETPLIIDVVRQSPARSGSRCPWWTLAPHDLALLTRLLGEPESLRVLASNDGVQALLSWPRAHAKLVYSTVAPNKHRQWRINGGVNQSVFDEVDGVLRTSGETGAPTVFADADPLRAELRHFASVARGETQVRTGLDEAEESVRLLCGGEEQLRVARRNHTFEQRPRDAVGTP